MLQAFFDKRPKFGLVTKPSVEIRMFAITTYLRSFTPSVTLQVRICSKAFAFASFESEVNRVQPRDEAGRWITFVRYGVSAFLRWRPATYLHVDSEGPLWAKKRSSRRPEMLPFCPRKQTPVVVGVPTSSSIKPTSANGEFL